MHAILEGLQNALQLLISLDREAYEIILLSMYVSLMSTMVSTLLGVPLGMLLGLKRFPMKRMVVQTVYTLMSLPPVIVGLLVFLILSRKGPLGHLALIFSPAAMVIAQVTLITPIVVGVIYNGTKDKGPLIRNIGLTLGASRWQTLLLLVRELKNNIFTAIVTGYGRAVSEVGAVMIVGGNIKGHTRVMTTSIAMLQSMGDYDMAIALGIVLLLIAFGVNSLLYHFQQGE